MKFHSIAVFSLAAVHQTSAFNNVNLRIVDNLREQLAGADFTRGDSLGFLKFYADSFLWSFSKLVENIQAVYEDVAVVNNMVNNANDQISEQSSLISDLYDQLYAAEDQVNAIEDEIDQTKDQVDEQLTQTQDALQDAAVNDLFPDDAVEGSGDAGSLMPSADEILAWENALKASIDFDSMGFTEQLFAQFQLDAMKAEIANFDYENNDIALLKQTIATGTNMMIRTEDFVKDNSAKPYKEMAPEWQKFRRHVKRQGISI